MTDHAEFLTTAQMIAEYILDGMTPEAYLAEAGGYPLDAAKDAIRWEIEEPGLTFEFTHNLPWTWENLRPAVAVALSRMLTE